jgi:restriction system protein
MLGRKSIHASEAFVGNFIGADFKIDEDLSGKLPNDWREFNEKFIPIYLKNHPDKTKVAAGLACGNLWTICKGLQQGDIALCPDGKGCYMVGEILDDYSYHPNEVLPHRRTVRWYSKTVERAKMSVPLKNSTGSIGTVGNISKHSVEIEGLIAGNRPPILVSTDENVEDPAVFAMEQYLEQFIVDNWHQMELGKHYDIYEEEGELAGRQYRTDDAGEIDILAISKDKKELLVIELKKGRASDKVVGQILRYMGYVQEMLAEEEQTVKGIIIALEDDIRIRRALSITKNIDFYRYQVTFKLIKHNQQQ